MEVRERRAPGSLDVAQSLDNLGLVAQDRGDLDKAVLLYEQAVSIIETQRGQVRSPEGRALLTERHGIPLQLYPVVLLEAGRPTAAYVAVERYRAAGFREQLMERGTDWYAEVPGGLVKKQRDLDNRRCMAYRRLATLPYPKSDETKMAREQIKQIEVEQRQLDEEMRRASPKYASIVYPKPPTLSEVRKALDSGTLHLSYVVGDDETPLFALPGGYGSKDGGLKVFRIEVPAKKLAERIGNFRTYLRHAGSTHSAKLTATIGASLYKDLIAPAEGMIRNAQRVVISPDGPLHKLPFAALNRNETEPKHYLIELKPLHIAPSLGVYGQLRLDRDRRVETTIPFAGFACPVTVAQRKVMEERLGQDKAGEADLALLSGTERAVRGANVKELPDALREVEHGSRVFGSGSEVFLDEQASRAKLWEIAPKARVLHLGCHGGYLDARPLESFVRLAPSGDDHGVVWAWQVMRELKLTADLVVLSACESALGRQSMYEGILGLTRALHYSGARSVLASLWKVDSRRAADLMIAFYDELARGVTKDVALQRAMLAMLKDPATAAPYYWSGFILSGDWK